MVSMVFEKVLPKLKIGAIERNSSYKIGRRKVNE